MWRIQLIQSAGDGDYPGRSRPGACRGCPEAPDEKAGQAEFGAW